jgi:hypothetical protein
LQAASSSSGPLDHHHVAARQRGGKRRQGFSVAMAMFRTAEGRTVTNISSASEE